MMSTVTKTIDELKQENHRLRVEIGELDDEVESLKERNRNVIKNYKVKESTLQKTYYILYDELDKEDYDIIANKIEKAEEKIEKEIWEEEE